jgi:hypothetical protein
MKTMAELKAAGYAVKDGVAYKVGSGETSASASFQAGVERKGAPVRPLSHPDDDADLSWQKVEARCRQVFEKAGCAVYSTSQRRRSKVSAGICDLIVFAPPGQKWCLMWETKAGRGKLSEAQRKFALHCHRTGVAYWSGGVSKAREVVRALGSATS